jgi:hypothetical protein
MNCDQILALYKLLPIYQDKVAKQKPTPTKKEG